MAFLIELTGQTFGKWRVISRVKATSKWLCRCECGVERVVHSHTLRDSRSTSCGCGRKAALAAKRGEHGTEWKAAARAQAAARAAKPKTDGMGSYASRMKAKYF